MEISSELKGFLEGVQSKFNLKKTDDLHIYEVLKFFYENGYDYLNPSATRIMDYFEKYEKEIETTKNLSIGKASDYKNILKGALSVADKSLSRNIEISHFIVATINYWSKKEKVPEELVMKTNMMLLDRNSMRHNILKTMAKNKRHITRKYKPSKKKFTPHHFEQTLKEQIVLNREFISEIASILSLKFMQLDLKPYLPNGIFLFIGKKSSGKSEFAYSIAATVYNSREAVSEIDLSLMTLPPTEAQNSEEENESVPGQGSFFKSIVQEGTKRVFLIKNMEAMDKGFFMLLSQIFSKGNLHLKNGRLDFSDSIFILTINKDILTSLTKKIGFQSETNEKTNLEIKEIIKKDFGEEFISYFDGIYIFSDLTLDDYTILFDKKFQQIREMSLKRGIELNISKDVIGNLAKLYINESKIIPNQMGRFIEQKVLIPLVKEMKEDPEKKTFKIFLRNNQIKIS